MIWAIIEIGVLVSSSSFTTFASLVCINVLAIEVFWQSLKCFCSNRTEVPDAAAISETVIGSEKWREMNSTAKIIARTRPLMSVVEAR